jgi:hypothetical protein
MGASSWPVNTSSLFPTLNTVDLFFREGLKKNPFPPPAPLLPAASSAPSRSSLQCCGIVTIFYSSGSGSDFLKNYDSGSDFWVRLFKSYGSGSGSDF